MRAKRNFKIKLLICCLAVLLLGTLLAACNKYEPDHYDYLVTFCYNLGGNISGNAPDVYLGVLDPEKDGALVGIRPGYNSSSFSEASIAGYYLDGWYEAKLVNNEIVKDADGRVVLEDTPFDFEHQRIDKDTTLYAKLVKSPRMLFVDADTDETVSELDGKRPGEKRSRPTGSFVPQKTLDGEPYTFMGEYYEDKECTIPFQFPYTFKDYDVKVYCKFIKGEWAIVSSVGSFNSAVGNGQNIYLMDDIDFSGQIFSSEIYNGELNGNGHTISGISLSYVDSRAITTKTPRQVGIFQILMGRAYVHDVKFEGVTIDVEVKKLSDKEGVETFQNVRIGVLAAEAREGARVENVTVAGTLTCNEYAYKCVEGNAIDVHPFIPRLTDANLEKIVNCDYSGVKLIYLS